MITKTKTGNYLKNLIPIIAMLFITIANAQDALKLDLEKCIEIAIENNHQLKIAEYDKEKADEQITEAFGSAVLPKINGNVNYSRALKRGVIILDIPGFSGSFPQGTENTMTLSATLEQPLFTGAVFFATSIARVYADISARSFYSAKATLIKDVKSTYYSYIIAKQFLDLSNLTIEAARENYKDTKAMFDAGIASEYDLIRSNVQVQNLLPDVNQAENSIKLAENALKLVMGLNLNQQIEIDGSLKYKSMPVDEYADLVQTLEARNFSLQQLKLQIELQDKAESYQFSKHFPELYFNGSWNNVAQENDPRPFSQWRYKNSFYIGLNLKVPIFDGFQTTSKVEQAELDLKKAQEQYDLTSSALKNQLEDILLQIKETQFKIDAYSATIEQAEKGYDISQKRYSSGIGTQLENIDALVELTRARVNYLNAVYEYYVLHAQLEELLSSEVQVPAEE